MVISRFRFYIDLFQGTLFDGEFIKELVPTKQEAITWLDKYVAALDGDAKAEKWLLDQDK